MEAAADPVGVGAQLRRQGGADLELGGGQDRAETERGGGAGGTGQEEGLGRVTNWTMDFSRPPVS